MEENVKLTKLAKCAGCGAKVGAGVLAQLLEGIQVHKDPNLLVGFDKSDDASVYKVSDSWRWYRRWTFSRPLPTIPIPSARSQPPTPCRISTPWAVTPSLL